MKYKQKVIPSVKTPLAWKTANPNQLRILVIKHYAKHIQGKKIKNLHLGLELCFTGTGKQKSTRGSAMYLSKAVAVRILPELLRVAEYSNYKPRKKTDPSGLLGYFNFKAKIIIDGKKQSLRIATLFYEKDGKLYYNLEVNKKVLT